MVYYHIQLSEDASNSCTSVLATLSQIMGGKLEVPISHACGWVNGRITIVVALLYSHMICGARLPSPLRDQETDWDVVSGLGLAQ